MLQCLIRPYVRASIKCRADWDIFWSHASCIRIIFTFHFTRRWRGIDIINIYFLRRLGAANNTITISPQKLLIRSSSRSLFRPHVTQILPFHFIEMRKFNFRLMIYAISIQRRYRRRVDSFSWGRLFAIILYETWLSLADYIRADIGMTIQPQPPACHLALCMLSRLILMPLLIDAYTSITGYAYFYCTNYIFSLFSAITYRLFLILEIFWCRRIFIR